VSDLSRATHDRIVAATDAIWMDEPPDLARVRFGIMDNGAGSGQQTFTVLVHLEAYTMIVAHEVIYRLLRVVNEEKIELDLAARMTHRFLVGDFDLPEFFADLGLNELRNLLREYLACVDEVEDIEEYIRLTGAMQTYMARTHRWIHLMFPWNLGVAFPHRTREELAYGAGLPLYSGPEA
jgi:hypothetical protein